MLWTFRAKGVTVILLMQECHRCPVGRARTYAWEKNIKSSAIKKNAAVCATDMNDTLKYLNCFQKLAYRDAPKFWPPKIIG